eukprot:829021-Pelagomonas_calceolata.AAC.5
MPRLHSLVKLSRVARMQCWQVATVRGTELQQLRGRHPAFEVSKKYVQLCSFCMHLRSSGLVLNEHKSTICITILNSCTYFTNTLRICVSQVQTAGHDWPACMSCATITAGACHRSVTRVPEYSLNLLGFNQNCFAVVAQFLVKRAHLCQGKGALTKARCAKQSAVYPAMAFCTRESGSKGRMKSLPLNSVAALASSTFDASTTGVSDVCCSGGGCSCGTGEGSGALPPVCSMHAGTEMECLIDMEDCSIQKPSQGSNPSFA